MVSYEGGPCRHVWDVWGPSESSLCLKCGIRLDLREPRDMFYRLLRGILYKGGKLKGFCTRLMAELMLLGVIFLILVGISRLNPAVMAPFWRWLMG